MLFWGIEAFRPPSHFAREEEYCAHLHSLNEQISWILRLRREVFAEHLENSSLLNSLVLLDLSILHHLTPSRRDDRCTEYQQILESELLLRTVKLADRILVTAPSMLLRTVDLPQWMRYWCGMMDEEGMERGAGRLEDEVLFRLMRTLFRVGVVMRKQLVVLAAKLDVARLQDRDIRLLAMMIAAAQLKVEEELSTAVVGSLLATLLSRENLIGVVQALRYVSFHSCWESPVFVGKLAGVLATLAAEQIRLLTDLAESTPELACLRPLAKTLTLAMDEREKIDVIIAAVPSLSLEEASKQLGRLDGDVQQVILAASKKEQDQAFVRMLDDKSFVRANLAKFRATLLVEEEEGEGEGEQRGNRLYEDEYVDTFDSSPGQPPPSAGTIDRKKDSDALSPTDRELMRAYIKDPGVFGRKAAIRQSAARKTLLQKLQLSHEQLEGWALMLERNVRLVIPSSALAHTLPLCSLERMLSSMTLPFYTELANSTCQC